MDILRDDVMGGTDVEQIRMFSLLARARAIVSPKITKP
jgi:hypothetical protein